MLRFTDLVRGSEIVSEIRKKFPETTPVFIKFRLQDGCYDCPIENAARRAGVALDELLVQLNEVVYKARGITA